MYDVSRRKPESRCSTRTNETDPNASNSSTPIRMDQVLEELKYKRNVASLEIPDVDDITATLYVLNGGTLPLKPLIGDFAYNFARGTFEIFHSNCWRPCTVSDVRSLVRHPKNNNTVVSFTGGGVPFWKRMVHGQVTQRCTFTSVEEILKHFRRTFDSSKLKIVTFSPATSPTNAEQRSDGRSERFANVLHVRLW